MRKKFHVTPRYEDRFVRPCAKLGLKFGEVKTLDESACSDEAFKTLVDLGALYVTPIAQPVPLTEPFVPAVVDTSDLVEDVPVKDKPKTTRQKPRQVLVEGTPEPKETTEQS